MIGTTIGSYAILRQLGTGAMGEVYLAEHRHLKRKAAVKLLAPEIVGRPDLLERFFLEARATSAIDHPGIVQIFDCEVDATGRPYIVMEYLDGETLAATLSRRGPLPAATVARFARGMAEALDAAHAKGIVHRDIKPENIFVQAQPPDSVKLVDFGIAKLAGDFRAGQVHQTRIGAMMGTPLYMSPEQCRDSGKIDFRTDLYSLGCVMFEMLTGRPPFVHEALGDLVVAHMTEQAEDVRALSPTVPKVLAELTAELLRKDPTQRPANMRAVSDRLAAFIGGLTTVPEATPSAAAAPAPAKKKTTFGDAASEILSTGERPAKPGRRAPMLFGLAAVAAALVAGGIVMTRNRGQQGAPATAATATAENAPVANVPARTAAIAGPPQLPRMVGEGSVAKTSSASKRETTASNTAPSKEAAASTPAPNKEDAPSTPAPNKEDAPSTPAPNKEAIAANLAPDPAAKPASNRDEARAKRSTGRRLAEATPPPDGYPNPGAAAQTAPAADMAPPLDFTGVWEGPWTDGVRHQNGRLYLQIASDGGVAGWLTNGAAHQSFRMGGRMGTPGDLALACECPPQQGFAARVMIHAAAGGELKGQIALSGTTGIFGQSHVVLRRPLPR